MSSAGSAILTESVNLHAFLKSLQTSSSNPRGELIAAHVSHNNPEAFDISGIHTFTDKDNSEDKVTTPEKINVEEFLRRVIPTLEKFVHVFHVLSHANENPENQDNEKFQEALKALFRSFVSWVSKLGNKMEELTSNTKKS